MTSNKSYFSLSKIPETSPHDIGFSPIGDKKIPNEYLDFKLDIEKTLCTINALFKQDEEVRMQFYEQVYNAAKFGFSGIDGDIIPAIQQINETKKIILKSSWVKVRNKIMIAQGIFSIIFIIVLSIIQFFAHEILRNIPLVLIGTCLGSWILTSMRTGNITFDEIYDNINQFKNCFIRMCYGCVLSTIITICMLAGFFEIKIGNISSSMLPENNFISISIGVLLGLGESSLATKLSDKAKEVI